MKNPAPRMAAEFIGTFALIFAGVGSIMTGALINQSSLLVVALAHGLAIAIMVTALANASGAHFNPAVSFAMFITQRMNVTEFAAYVVAQLAGGTAAALVLNAAFDTTTATATNLGTPAVATGLSAGTALLLEAVMTYFLVLVIFTVAVDSKGAFGSVAGFPIGLIIATMIFVGGPLTGAALNPARWFGPAAVTGTWTHWSTWIVGPLLGATLAAITFDYLLVQKRAVRRKPRAKSAR